MKRTPSMFSTSLVIQKSRTHQPVSFDNYKDTLKLFSPSHLISDLGQTCCQFNHRRIPNDQHALRNSFQALNNQYKQKLSETVDRLHPKDLTSQDYFPPGQHQCGSTQYGRMNGCCKSDIKSYMVDNQKQNIKKEKYYKEIE